MNLQTLERRAGSCGIAQVVRGSVSTPGLLAYRLTRAEGVEHEGGLLGWYVLGWLVAYAGAFPYARLTCRPSGGQVTGDLATGRWKRFKAYEPVHLPV